MKRTTARLVAFVLCAVCATVSADYSVGDRGTWPKSWPKELEPLRERSRTFEGPMVLLLHYEIPFAKREEFEAAWPHLLRVKSKGAPIVLVRAPRNIIFKVKAGVVVHCPPADREKQEEPVPAQRSDKAYWRWANYIELVVDGDVVDLNRIPLPADTPIIDERFKEGEKAVKAGGG